MRMGVVFAAAALTVTAGVAGCGGSAGSPQALPSLSPAASASPPPSPVPTGVQASTTSPEAAAEFAKFFYAEIEQAFATKDPERIARLSLPSCRTCAAYVTSIKKLRDNGERLEGGQFKIKFAAAPGLENGKASVDVQWVYSGSIRYAANGSVIRRTASLPAEEEVDLVSSGVGWRIAAVKRIR
jgi:hypothetical protein